MNNQPLRQAVNTFAQLTHHFTEDDLNNDGWAWRTYDQVRYAHLQTCLELRQLAADLAAERMGRGQPLTLAQHILARHHAAYHDFCALFIGITDHELDILPAPDEWPLRRILSHVNAAEQFFFQVIRHALKQHRQEVFELSTITDDTMAYLEHKDITAIFNGPLTGSLAYYDDIHTSILNELGTLEATDLEVNTLWWEGEPFPIRFRLHRFELHLREHAIQIEKMLPAIHRSPNEVKRLLRHIYGALAEVEGATLGLAAFEGDKQQTLADVIVKRAESVAAFVKAK